MKQKPSLWSRLFLPAAILLVAVTFTFAQTSRSMSLAGRWQFELDPNNVGEGHQWFNRQLRNSIHLPGILQSQGFGNPISTETPWVLTLYDRFWYLRDDYKAYLEPGKVKVPFLSQPPRHYLGAAWYQREVSVPWPAGRRIVLTLERPHWETTVWLDGRKIGSERSLVAPHVFDLGTVTSGRHRLTIRVDNRMIMPYRPDAHSVSDSVGNSWNGIVGRIELHDTGRVWIDDAQVFPDVTRKTALVKVRIGNVTGRSGSGVLTAASPQFAAVPVNWDEHGGAAEIEVPVGADAETWDEFNPKLYPLKLWLKGAEVDEHKELSFGLRDFRAVGKDFILNGRPINFRGTHNGGDFPLTGYPPTDVQSWLKIFETSRSWGLNHMRFHSWCPPEAAFEAADQIGFYLQPEPGMWNEISPGTPIEKMLYEETDRMIKAYGNHPSFMLLSASNEPKGRWQEEALPRWVAHYRKQDPRRLYASGTGHTEPEIENITEGTDYLAIQRIGPKMLRRESGWFGSDFGPSLEGIDIPVISHEVGQWVAYPDYSIINKFKGYMRPGNYEIFRDSMEANGLLAKNQAFAVASGRFQVACYKEEIEANLRTPGLSGFQLLDLRDFLGQGTALVGLLDAFWESKNYVSGNEFKQFNNATVPLARLKRVYTTADTFVADVEIAHFGAAPIENGKAVWHVGDPYMPIAHGEFPTRLIPIGKNISLGRISIDASKFPAPAYHPLIVTVGPESLFESGTGKIREGAKATLGKDYFQNRWNFWVYPANLRDDEPVGSWKCPLSRSPDVLITRSWDEAERKLAAGGRVLFVPANSALKWNSPPLDTVPVFWNRQMGPAWGRMLGLLVESNDDHQFSYALAGFPTTESFDWQWASIISNVRAINLGQLPRELEPTVWAIDDWNRNYKLGVIFECAVGNGKLLVSAFDVTKPGNSNAVARQLRFSLLNYIHSDCFQPKISVPAERIRDLFFDNQIMKKLGAVATVNGEPANATIDGDPTTFLLFGDRRAELRESIEIRFDFPAPVTFSGIVLMPRQNHREHEGDIREYSIQTSDDGNVWREVQRGELPSTFAPLQIDFDRPMTTRYLKFVSLSGFGPDKLTALAELAVIYSGPKLNESGDVQYQRNRTATPEIDEGPQKPKATPTPNRKPQTKP